MTYAVGGAGRVTVHPPAPLPPPQRRYACFNTVLDLSCNSAASAGSSSSSSVDGGATMLVFERARYGRNDTVGAARCRVPFTRNCDFDVQHSLSQACGGRHRCSLAVNTKFFGDPCGYDEFLTVVYRCVHGTTMSCSCLSISRTFFVLNCILYIYMSFMYVTFVVCRSLLLSILCVYGPCCLK